MKTYNVVKTAIIILIFCITGTLISCSFIDDIKNMQIPETVSVKTEGSYSLPLGQATAKLKDHMSVSKLQEIITDNTSGGADSPVFEIYDFNDITDSSAQKYLFNYSVAEIPLDISSYLQNLDTLDFSSNNTFSQTVCVDKQNIVESQEVGNELDFGEVVKDKISCTINNLYFPQSGTSDALEIELEKITVNFTQPDFDSVHFKTGNLIISFTQQDGSSDEEIQIKATLLDTNEQEISSSDLITVRERNGTMNSIVMPMNGKSLDSAFKLNLYAKSSYGQENTASLLNANLNFSNDTELDKVTGLTISESELESYFFDVNTTVDTSSIGDTIKSAQIDDGSLFYYVEVPEGWTGIKINPQLEVSGDLEISKDSFTNVSSDYAVYKSANLHGKTYSPNAGLSINGQIKFSVNNATLDLDSSDKITFYGGVKINSLKNAKVYLDKLVNTSNLSKNISQTISNDVTKYIEKIVFKKVGLEGTINTNLPSSNMLLDGELSSTFFDISPSEPLAIQTVDFSKSSPYALSMIKDYGEEMLEKTLADNSTVDFDIDFNLYSSDEIDSSLVTLSSFVLGTEYNFDFEISLVYDWEEIVLNTQSQSLSGSIDTGLNLKTFLGDISDEGFIGEILDKTKFKTDAIKGYFYITKPNLAGLDDFTGFSGSITATYDGGSASLLTGSDLRFVSASKTFAELADDEGIITDISKIDYSGELNGESLVSIINEKPENLGFDYSLVMASGDGDSTITIKKSDVDTLQESGYSTSIKMSLAMILALKLEVIDDINVNDVFSSFGIEMEDDLLGRNSAEETSDFEEYADMVKGIYLQYLFQNNIGLSLNAYFVATNEGGVKYLGWDEEKGIYTKEISILKGSSNKWEKNSKTIGLNRTEIKSIFSNYKFIPQVILEIPAQDFIVPRDASFSARAVITAETDNEYVIWGGEDE